jgi:hypothetical protein
MGKIKSLGKFIAEAIIVLTIFTSCYYDSKEFLYPELISGCDTSNVTFSNSVSPLLQQFCYSCHSNASAASFGSNIKLQDYADVKNYADNGKLLGTVQQLSGYSPMPKGSGKIPNCDILLIEQWINVGTPNN